ncbi:hypothetical protein M0R19_06305 [Candidatus Pacearchaeota archaeon]|jgi:hypothetical protein|nr:hypothetical protein [Candidatus Pacearchaeota archaeon]
MENQEIWSDFDAYEKLIYQQSWKFHQQFRAYTIEDLFHEGVLVFAKCKQKYDPSRNVKFVTFLQICLFRHFLALLHYKEKHLTTTDWKNKVNHHATESTLEFSEFSYSISSIRNVKIIPLNGSSKVLMEKLRPFILEGRQVNWKTRKNLIPQIKKCLLVW